jgi:hypothetical protein
MKMKMSKRQFIERLDLKELLQPSDWLTHDILDSDHIFAEAFEGQHDLEFEFAVVLTPKGPYDFEGYVYFWDGVTHITSSDSIEKLYLFFHEYYRHEMK